MHVPISVSQFTLTASFILLQCKRKDIRNCVAKIDVFIWWTKRKHQINHNHGILHFIFPAVSLISISNAFFKCILLLFQLPEPEYDICITSCAWATFILLSFHFILQFHIRVYSEWKQWYVSTEYGSSECWVTLNM